MHVNCLAQCLAHSKVLNTSYYYLRRVHLAYAKDHIFESYKGTVITT